ncbi:MAG: MinD/ParA family protein [Myxococcales bacterium]|nr:MAG: MinD/ParA family protein [Myxococcales bacterium]
MPASRAPRHASQTPSGGEAKRGFAPLVVAVTSGKGGVGKTTLAVNLGVDFTARGRKVLLVDGDLGLANVDIMFGIRPLYTFQHLISGEKNLEEIIVRGPSGIHILPASSGVSELANLDADTQMRIIGQLETLGGRYDAILIDTAAGISSNVMHFAAAAQFVIVVVTHEPTSLADAYAVIKVLNQKYNVHRFQLVVNSSDSEAAARRVYQTLSDIADNFIDVVIDYLGAIPRDPDVIKSVGSQRPFVEMFPSGAATRALHGLSEALLAKRSRVRQGDAPMLWTRIIE